MKDKQPSPQEPLESDIERRVDQMLDVDTPDTPKPTAVPVAEPQTPAKVSKPTKVTVVDTSESEPITPSAPPVKKARAKKTKSIAVTIHEEDASTNSIDDPTQATEANPVVEPDAAVPPPVKSKSPAVKVLVTEAPQTAPVLPDAPIPEELSSGPKLVVVDNTGDPVPTAETTAAADDKADITIDEAIKQAETLPEADPLEADEIPLSDTLDEPVTNKAVDEIIAEEADELLAVQDGMALEEEPIVRRSIGGRLKAVLTSSKFRWAVFLIVVGAVIGVGAWPSTRYAALNAVGVRAQASLLVTDQSTLQPLKNVEVKIGDATLLTDKDGRVAFQKLRLGPADFSITKKAFAPITGSVTVGWGSNPLPERKLSPVGLQYAFVVTDFLSGKPVGAASAAAGPADAAADDSGKIRLTLEHSEVQTTDVTISAPGYRDEKVQLDLASKLEIPLKLVPSKQHVFVSKRSGKFDIYKTDIDGKNESVLLAGTGSERDDIAISTHQVDDLVAVVSTRDNKRNADGYLMSTLTLINTTDGKPRTISQSEQISLVGWTNSNLIYVQIAAGASAANPNRQRLMSFDFKQSNNKQIASTNYFNDVLVAGNYIYYAPSSTYQESGVASHLFRINPDGSSKQTVLGVETWNIVRSDYSTLLFSVPNEWYDYKLGGVAARKLDQQPSAVTSRIYTDSPDGKQSLWVDQRDGKGTLIMYNTESKTEKTLLAKTGLKTPVRWLNEKVIIYRSNTSSETADYAVSLDGGEPVKIRDVSATGGVDNWYYY